MSLSAEIHPGALTDKQLSAIVAALGDAGNQGELKLSGSAGSGVELPDGLARILCSIVEHLKAGNGVAVSPLYAELTTAQAAQLLNVSRPHVIKLLDDGAMAHHLVGTHRRIRLSDVLAYRDRQQQASRLALDELTQQAEELKLY